MVTTFTSLQTVRHGNPLLHASWTGKMCRCSGTMWSFWMHNPGTIPSTSYARRLPGCKLFSFTSLQGSWQLSGWTKLLVFVFGHQQAHRSTWALFFAVAWMTCAPISVCWVGLLFSKLWCPIQAAGEVSLQTGTVWVKLWWEVGMLLGTNFSHWMHLSVSTVVYDSVSLILYNLILLFRLNFVISCPAQLATLACAKMRAVWWGKSSEKPWQKKSGNVVLIGSGGVSKYIYI